MIYVFMSLQVHKIKTDPESSTQANESYSTAVINTAAIPVQSNGPIETTQSPNNSRNPVIQQIIVQPTELLPVLPAHNAKQDSPKETISTISKD